MQLKVALACVVAVLLATLSMASAQSSNSSVTPLYHNDEARDCNGAHPDVSGAPASGHVVVLANPDGTVTVNIVILNGLPNTTYFPNIICQFFFGELTTNKNGNAAGHFVLADPLLTFPLSVSLHVFAPDDDFTSTELTPK